MAEGTADAATSTGQVFYAKALLDQDVVRAFVLTHPKGESKTFDSVAGRLAECFRPVDAADGPATGKQKS